MVWLHISTFPFHHAWFPLTVTVHFLHVSATLHPYLHDLSYCSRKEAPPPPCLIANKPQAGFHLHRDCSRPPTCTHTLLCRLPHTYEVYPCKCNDMVTHTCSETQEGIYTHIYNLLIRREVFLQHPLKREIDERCKESKGWQERIKPTVNEGVRERTTRQKNADTNFFCGHLICSYSHAHPHQHTHTHNHTHTCTHRDSSPAA